jgi:hypothetical protein
MDARFASSWPASSLAGGTACDACGGSTTELYFAPTGVAVCKRCHYAGEIRAQGARAAASLAAQAPPGFKPAGVRHETRAASTRNGFLLLGMCVASTVITAVLLDRIYLASGILGVLALAAFARARKLDAHERRGRIWIGLGVAVTVGVLLAIVAVAILGV